MPPAIPEQLRLLVEDWRGRANDPTSYVPAARDAYLAAAIALERAVTDLYGAPLVSTDVITRLRERADT